jgi:hypothetical protein
VTSRSESEDVSVAEELLRLARERYPPGGSADGTPGFEHFERGPLAAAVSYFEREFDEALEAAAGVRFYMTVGTFFPAMAFFAARVGSGIQVLSFTVDDEYGAILNEDPDD